MSKPLYGSYGNSCCKSKSLHNFSGSGAFIGDSSSSLSQFISNTQQTDTSTTVTTGTVDGIPDPLVLNSITAVVDLKSLDNFVANRASVANILDIGLGDLILKFNEISSNNSNIVLKPFVSDDLEFTNVFIDKNLIVKGEYTRLDTIDTRMVAKIPIIGYLEGSVTDDDCDRGFEFNWPEESPPLSGSFVKRVGFLGWDKASDRFVFWKRAGRTGPTEHNYERTSIEPNEAEIDILYTNIIKSEDITGSGNVDLLISAGNGLSALTVNSSSEEHNTFMLKYDVNTSEEHVVDANSSGAGSFSVYTFDNPTTEKFELTNSKIDIFHDQNINIRTFTSGSVNLTSADSVDIDATNEVTINSDTSQVGINAQTNLTTETQNGVLRIISRDGGAEPSSIPTTLLNGDIVMRATDNIYNEATGTVHLKAGNYVKIEPVLKVDTVQDCGSGEVTVETDLCIDDNFSLFVHTVREKTDRLLLQSGNFIPSGVGTDNTVYIRSQDNFDVLVSDTVQLESTDILATASNSILYSSNNASTYRTTGNSSLNLGTTGTGTIEINTVNADINIRSNGTSRDVLIESDDNSVNILANSTFVPTSDNSVNIIASSSVVPSIPNSIVLAACSTVNTHGIASGTKILLKTTDAGDDISIHTEQGGVGIYAGVNPTSSGGCGPYTPDNGEIKLNAATHVEIDPVLRVSTISPCHTLTDIVVTGTLNVEFLCIDNELQVGCIVQKVDNVDIKATSSITLTANSNVDIDTNTGNIDIRVNGAGNNINFISTYGSTSKAIFSTDLVRIAGGGGIEFEPVGSNPGGGFGVSTNTLWMDTGTSINRLKHSDDYVVKITDDVSVNTNEIAVFAGDGSAESGHLIKRTAITIDNADLTVPVYGEVNVNGFLHACNPGNENAANKLIWATDTSPLTYDVFDFFDTPVDTTLPGQMIWLDNDGTSTGFKLTLPPINDSPVKTLTFDTSAQIVEWTDPPAATTTLQGAYDNGASADGGLIQLSSDPGALIVQHYTAGDFVAFEIKNNSGNSVLEVWPNYSTANGKTLRVTGGIEIISGMLCGTQGVEFERTSPPPFTSSTNINDTLWINDGGYAGGNDGQILHGDNRILVELLTTIGNEPEVTPNDVAVFAGTGSNFDSNLIKPTNIQIDNNCLRILHDGTSPGKIVFEVDDDSHTYTILPGDLTTDVLLFLDVPDVGADFFVYKNSTQDLQNKIITNLNNNVSADMFQFSANYGLNSGAVASTTAQMIYYDSSNQLFTLTASTIPSIGDVLTFNGTTPLWQSPSITALTFGVNPPVDLTATGPTVDCQMLYYDSGTGTFELTPAVAPTSGDVLTHDGTSPSWVPNNLQTVYDNSVTLGGATAEILLSTERVRIRGAEAVTTTTTENLFDIVDNSNVNYFSVDKLSTANDVSVNFGSTGPIITANFINSSGVPKVSITPDDDALGATNKVATFTGNIKVTGTVDPISVMFTGDTGVVDLADNVFDPPVGGTPSAPTDGTLWIKNVDPGALIFSSGHTGGNKRNLIMSNYVREFIPSSTDQEENVYDTEHSTVFVSTNTGANSTKWVLPSTSQNGQMYYFKNSSTSVNSDTLADSGLTTIDTLLPNEFAIVVGTSTTWIVLFKG